TEVVVQDIARRPQERWPDVEAVQDAIELALMREGYGEVARSYILYRKHRSDIRMAKSALGLKDDLKFPVNTMAVLERRYLLKDDERNVIETPGELFRRVARHVARAEERFPAKVSPAEVEERFFRMMRDRQFMPNSPTLMNAGTALGQLSACFVLPVPDSIDGIFNSLKDMAKIHQTGGGTGFNFSHLRPKGDLVASTKGEASGPVSFMGIFDKATEIIIQGGRRRGANMGIMRCDHPDIVDFIEAKTKSGAFSNFNLSVAVTDAFMAAAARNASFDLINPRTKKKQRRIKAGDLFDLITTSAWRTGDPGLIFLDEINRRNPTPELGPLEATNPCGELPLLSYESCNLASLNLERMISSGDVDWEKLRDCIRWGIRFLDDVIEMNKFPLPEVQAITQGNRKIGLGVMGFADMLLRLRIPYTAKAAVELADRLMAFIREESLRASATLARERGVFPNFGKSIYRKQKLQLRNATVNTIAPTGTISIIAGCSSGIEPLFAVSFVRNVLSGTQLFEINPIFAEVAQKGGFFGNDTLAKIARQGSLRDIAEIPAGVRRLFVTAFDVTARQHLLIQAAFQRHTDNSVSKTINLPTQATVEDVKMIYRLAHRLKCKGITIYRYGSKKDQVLSYGAGSDPRGDAMRPILAGAEYAGGCATGDCVF
ncbi:MAG: adenosylcobalamin-dependent ribonucleoside-diphosphate reductase, partial [Smithellaceae bacterium]|nr:adenosylcobalamin-dependent ribonucleoside-diphosphate reductase [Smithellaceae bacterium]